MTQTPDRSRWTDERLDRFANTTEQSISQLSDRVERVVEGIERLIEALHVELPAVKAEVNGFREELQQSNKRMTRIESAIERQTTIAATQAESVRELIRLLNQKQA